MSEKPYQEFHPGDLICAEEINKMQSQIKEDIASQIAAAVKEIVEGKVAEADNALHFDALTPDGWIQRLMEVFAPKQHDHEGILSYQRYYLELETVIADVEPDTNRQQPAVIIHEMGRHPIVQVYELLWPFPEGYDPPDGAPSPDPDIGFVFCGPEHADPVWDVFVTASWDERHWGDPIDVVIHSLERGLDDEGRAALWAEFQDNFTLAAWLTNLERRLFEPGPGQYHFDVGDTYRTKWITDRNTSQVKTLKEQGEWPPRLVYRPLLLDRSGVRNPTNRAPPRMPVDVYHLNMNEVEIQVYSEDKPIRLMVLLRA